jgi:RNA polymerase primary sigma factor
MVETDVQAMLARALAELTSLGRHRGYVTEQDLAARLPDAEEDSALWVALTAALEASDIELYRDGAPPSAGAAPSLTARSAMLDGVESDDTVSLYFREVSAVPLLTRDEEVALARRIERGRRAQQRLLCGETSPLRHAALERSTVDGQAAYDHLVKANSRLVIAMAKKYRGQGVPFLDLIQEGNLGLMRAADKFDHRRGFKFSTYATWWIRQAITRALANQGRTIRVPVHLSDRIRKLFAIAQALEQDLGRNPTPAEIAVRMEVSEAKVRQMLRVARRNLSLEKPVGEDQDSELGHFIEDPATPDPLEEAAQDILRDDLDDLLLCLTAREARILRLRYGLDNGRPHTLKEVGRKFHLTRERIRQIEQEALAKLRHPHRRARFMSYLQ